MSEDNKEQVEAPATKSLVSIAFKSGSRYEAWYRSFTTEVVDGKVASISYVFDDPDQNSLHHINLNEIELIAVKKSVVLTKG